MKIPAYCDQCGGQLATAVRRGRLEVQVKHDCTTVQFAPTVYEALRHDERRIPNDSATLLKGSDELMSLR
jgi:hypothetical protein